MENVAERQIRATYDKDVVRVYQAYSNEIANSAIYEGTFVSPPFKMERMTWIKPSFLWMMYRSGWARKDSGQARILAIDISVSGFEWALANSCLSNNFSNLDDEEWQKLKSSKPVRIQWDPERDIHLNPLHSRTIQIGLSNEAVVKYTQQWIQNITDITEFVQGLEMRMRKGETKQVMDLLPAERVYPLPMTIAEIIGATI